jgi:DHA1 family bicyclomycin/chloramphenicol resistance-like MFS transporter
MYIPGLPELRHSFEATTPAAQLTFSVCLLGMAVGQIIFGPMSDALGRRRPLVWALAGYTVSAIVCVMTPWLWLLIVARLIQGATASAGSSSRAQSPGTCSQGVRRSCSMRA